MPRAAKSKKTKPVRPIKKDDSFDPDAWVSTTPTPSRCATCNHEGASARLLSVLESMAKLGAHEVQRRQIYEMLCNAYEDYSASWSAFRKCLRNHHYNLWLRAKHGDQEE